MKRASLLTEFLGVIAAVLLLMTPVTQGKSRKLKTHAKHASASLPASHVNPNQLKQIQPNQMNSLRANVAESSSSCTPANLASTLSVLLCRSNVAQGDSYSSAITSPTKVAISQLEHELAFGSVTNPTSLKKLNEALQVLRSFASENAIASFSNPNVRRQITSIPGVQEQLGALPQIIREYGSTLQKERNMLSTFMSEKHENSVEKFQQPVLERPLLLKKNFQSEKKSHTRHRREAVDVKLKVPNLQSCSLSNNVASSCSSSDIQSTVQALTATLNNAFLSVRDARLAILQEVIQSSSCSTPGVSRNQMAWSSLGAASLPLVQALQSLQSIEASDLSHLTPSIHNVEQSNANQLNEEAEVARTHLNESPIASNPFLALLSSVTSDDKSPLSGVTTTLAQLPTNQLLGILSGNGVSGAGGILPSGTTNLAGSTLSQLSKTGGLMNTNSNSKGGLLGILGK